MEQVILDGSSLTIEHVIAVAYGAPNHPRVIISNEAKIAINRSAEAVQTLLRDGVVAYGITTGFGAFKDKVIPPSDVELLQHNI
ncbi:MAG: aromatic amino acid lyase, partial [Anaerolineae bacterium]|nr:aromatic amino acid lyase [Anaerolineae bacterium]